ncbi:hypothetical protein [Proteiniphilum sp. X52]|uniref:hypothetical protein n=1 Tax=Proteiniphilum sp. X52 TaxID=2382159 RepID=UPI000F09CED9|nr:hypothetical protein [Proteiniphilum sp. X52]RNC65704.1 hypothetical protein D7D25_06045 [Proteiniphilum sp. X52]
MNIYEDIRLYLPKYLSEESTKKLLREIADFPNILDGSLYTNRLQNDNIIFQGDAIKELPVINLPDTTIKKTPSIILSNTCDIDEANERAFPSHICYAPIFNLEKYINAVKRIDKYKQEESLNQHIESIRKQYITQILYLPAGEGLDYEGIVFLDRINNCKNTIIERNNLKTKRLFTLSNYGHYLLLTKISIHFSRLQEKVDRNEGVIIK